MYREIFESFFKESCVWKVTYTRLEKRADHSDFGMESEIHI